MAARVVGGTRRVGGDPDNPTLSELGGLKENKVYIVSDVPAGRKAIPSKLVFKVKCGPNNEIVKFKA
eukprot:3708130-Rhodomonas_salina.2